MFSLLSTPWAGAKILTNELGSREENWLGGSLVVRVGEGLRRHLWVTTKTQRHGASESPGGGPRDELFSAARRLCSMGTITDPAIGPR